MADRYKISKKVSFISLVVNIILAILKIIIGINFGSKALLADGFHTVSDMASTLVILISLKFSQTPPDKSHPYGHGKAESIGTILLGLMLLFTGLAIFKDSVVNITTGVIVIPGMLTLWVAVISILTKEGLYQYTVNWGRKINSKGLIADAHHHRSDALSSVAALIGIAGARLGYPQLDPLAGLIVAAFIIKVGFDIFKDALNELMDGAPDEEKVALITAQAEKVAGVIKIGDIKIRTYGPKYFVDLTIVVADSLSVIEGHQVADSVKQKIKTLNSNVEEVLVHVDPRMVYDDLETNK